jgi:hypothetical protein
MTLLFLTLFTFLSNAFILPHSTLNRDISNNRITMVDSPKFVQEAEVKHGRVAMVSSVVIPFLDQMDPQILGVDYLSSLDINIQLSLLGIMGISEASQLLEVYNFPNTVDDWFTMLSDHVPGDYGIDPLNITNPENIYFLKNTEKVVGRVAMIGTAGEMVKELVFHQTIF